LQQAGPAQSQLASHIVDAATTQDHLIVRRRIPVKIEPFELERWLLQAHDYDLASAGIPKLRLKDITSDLDFNMVLNYGPTNGSEALRGRVAMQYDGIRPDQVLITTGTAEANLLVLMRLLEPGDEMIALSPTYQQCLGLSRRFGAKVNLVDLHEDCGYQLDLDQLAGRVTEKTKVIVLVNPNNPTGSILSADEMQGICAAASDVGAWVLCDGALRGLEVAGQKASTPVEFYERSIATGSISKIGLTGPRIGWMVTPDAQLLLDCWRYKDYTTLSHSGIGEYLAAIALEPENLSQIIARAHNVIKRHLTILKDWIGDHHGLVEWVPSKAGHTAFPRYRLSMDSITFCQTLLEEEGVLVGPGDFFGAPLHLRVRYSGEEAMFREGLKRLETFLLRHAAC
jgi:aspartate/methionine/tyrosine aminotransferase